MLICLFSFEIWFTFTTQNHEKIIKVPHSKFKYTFVSEQTVLELFRDKNEYKIAGLDNISGKFLKDIITVLAKTISQICNLSIKYSIFLTDCKIVELKPLLKKRFKNSPPKISSVSCSHKFLK